MTAHPSPVRRAAGVAGLLLPGLLWLSAGPVQAGPLDEGYQARYAVIRSGLPLGESLRTLRPLDGGDWQLDAHTAPTGLAALLFGDVIEEHSRLRRRQGTTVPLHYSYSQTGGRRDKVYALRFDWTGGLLHFAHSGEQRPLPADTQDPLSFVIAVMEHLQRGERRFAMTVAGRNKLRDYQVRIADQAILDTVLGRQTVTRVEAEEVGRDTRYDLWCLNDRDYLPLRIRQVQDDRVTDLRLRELRTPPPAATPP